MPQPTLPLGPTEGDWALIEALLQARHVPLPLRSELRGQLTGRYEGLLLYGSWARGDASDDSDLDTLVLNFNGIRPNQPGRVSVAAYDEGQLRELSETLFGYHLARDGVILLDRFGHLSTILKSIEPPRPGVVKERIRSLTPVLDVPDEDRDKYIEGLTQTARYLLRSALYAEALDRGEPCFSVRELAARSQDPDLAVVLSSHVEVRPAASQPVFNDLRARLNKLVGPLLPNTHGGLHALIEGTWKDDRDLSNFATLALCVNADELPYDELPKVTL